MIILGRCPFAAVDLLHVDQVVLAPHAMRNDWTAARQMDRARGWDRPPAARFGPMKVSPDFDGAEHLGVCRRG